MSRYKHALLRLLDLHDRENKRVYLYICLAVLAVVALWIRHSLIPFQNADYKIFSDWYDFAKLHGIQSFKYGYADGFSNYNPPYTYFLYLATLLPLAKIVAIKGLLVLFDLVLAVSVYFVVRLIRPRFYAMVAALVILFMPTVLMNGVFWGQFDQLYVALMLMSVYFSLKDKPHSGWAWAFFGLALSIKFQAIFLLPVVVVLCLQKIRWQKFYWAAIAFLVVTLPPVFVGRSVGSLLDIYPAQTRLFSGQLTLNAPSLYQWFPNSAFPFFNSMGIMLAMVAVILIIVSTLVMNKFHPRELLVTATLLLFVVPFLLPAMHERYFFPAGIVSLVLALIYPRLRYVMTAVVAQVVILFSYVPFLFGTTVLPMAWLSLGILGIIVALWADHLSPQISIQPESAAALPATKSGRAKRFV